MNKPLVVLYPVCDPREFHKARIDPTVVTLGDLLRRAPAVSETQIDDTLASVPLRHLRIEERAPLYPLPGGFHYTAPSPSGSEATATNTETPVAAPVKSDAETTSEEAMSTGERPTQLTDKMVVQLAYSGETDKVASFLRAGLSVLVLCDKLVVECLYKEMAAKAGLRPILPEITQSEAGGGFMGMPQSLRQRHLAQIKVLLKDLKKGDVLVVPHLDLMTGGSDSNLSAESCELTEILYAESDRLLLGFADRTLAIPEVLAARFAVRCMVSGVPREVTLTGGKKRALGDALVTEDEASRFDGYDPEGLYKNVAGMNPIRLRHAIAYANEEAGGGHVPVQKLYEAIRAFKAQISSKFEVPNVKFSEIGGYHEVKLQMIRALNLMLGNYALPNDKLRSELIPRGFIFYGPPGTGKTLFAKAIANRLNATIQVVSGPEVTDMYVGESERKVRELFAEARRNAPSVLVFDEFDSIAGKRSGRDDGGSRAGNALVAQILTEMDGFRPDVPMLVIGTTNRLNLIDPALLRPSRFQAIEIDLPNREARREIAKVHAKHFQVDISDELLGMIAYNTDQFNGDEIRSIFRDACVGQYCEDPPIAISAKRLGELVGTLRYAKDRLTRESSDNGHSQGRASSQMVNLTPRATEHAETEEN